MSAKEFPVALRFASVSPRQLARIQMHALRSGGSLDHVEPGLSARNRVYAGETFAADMRAEIREIARSNLDAELCALKERKRIKQARERAAEGPKDPWHANSDGPIREVILTAHTDYFRAPDNAPDANVILGGVSKACWFALCSSAPVG